MSHNKIVLAVALLWGINSLISVAQHEWYHATCEALIAFFLATWPEDENQ